MDDLWWNLVTKLRPTGPEIETSTKPSLSDVLTTITDLTTGHTRPIDRTDLRRNKVSNPNPSDPEDDPPTDRCLQAHSPLLQDRPRIFIDMAGRSRF
ncbi:hypothetical protein AVEN_51299-1 [Araneus ventricosus]|uniref:Uncharacterized protein n=1 Tax=Araneus ventricosus TaxID=182803 RepID=A0A4Y2RKA4_ARAVE|nr:hypothetical protein AVEN_51299-1 [Araneus ventricosus]